jgi:hypothetical protein
MYHPWASNILRKKKKKRTAVPAHLYVTYGVEMSR